MIIITLNVLDVTIDKSTQIKVDLSNCLEIYGLNKYIIKNMNENLTEEELELIEYIKNNIDFEKYKLNLMATEKPTYWFLAITGYNNYPFHLYNNDKIINWRKNIDADYLILLKRSLEHYGVSLSNINKTIFFENEAGIIMKKQ